MLAGVVEDVRQRKWNAEDGHGENDAELGQHILQLRVLSDFGLGYLWLEFSFYHN